jgi:hypothetical protein
VEANQITVQGEPAAGDSDGANIWLGWCGANPDNQPPSDFTKACTAFQQSIAVAKAATEAAEATQSLSSAPADNKENKIVKQSNTSAASSAASAAAATKEPNHRS